MKNRPTSINIDPADLAAADEAARAAGLSRSAWIVAAIRNALASDVSLTGAANVSNGADLATRVADIERQLALLMQQAPQPDPIQAYKPADPPADKHASNATHTPEVVAAAIRLRVEGLTFDQIAERLNAEGHKPAKAAAFKAYNVRRLLESPTHKAQRLAAGLKQ